MKKKVVSVLMAAAMVAGMAGCGSSNTGNAGTTNSNASTNNEATTESGDASASTATDSDVEKPEEITIMVDGTVFTQENGQAEFIAKLEDLLGMKINVIQPDHDAYYDVVGLARRYALIFYLLCRLCRAGSSVGYDRRLCIF